MEIQERYIEIAKEFAKRYQNDSNIIGITLSGGIARGTGDIYSEIDINFYVKDIKDKNLPPERDILVNGVWFDFKIRSFDNEVKKEWSMVDKWDTKNSLILFDRNGSLKDLIAIKTTLSPREIGKLCEEYTNKLKWSVLLAEVFDKRKDLKNAHFMINESVDAFVSYYFIKNNQFVPYFKWKYYYFQKLKIPSNKIKKKLLELILIKDYSKKELIRRIDKIREIISLEFRRKYLEHHMHQNITKLNEFIPSIKNGINYKKPW
ncbi:hypothetical protein J4423_04405 [Candidatus Pacearchaeota archaeon]|nr:hypothetical protein [Candidatus Pacearchaeota archaeon]